MTQDQDHSMTAAHMRAVRQRYGLSQAQLGVALDRTRQSISDWENGRAHIPLAIAGQCYLIAVHGPDFARDPWASAQ